MPRVKRDADGTPVAKPEVSPSTLIISHLQSAYAQADGALALNPPKERYQEYLTVATLTAELISVLRPSLRNWAIIAKGNRAELDELEQSS